MTQEEKELLFIDLCARLPYGVMVKQGNWKHTLKSVNMYNISFDSSCAIPIPYLRPMSSMTDEEKEEVKALGAEFSPFDSIRFCIEEDENDGFEYGYQWLDILDFLNSHHFDYRGLIEKGLALEAPKDMYKTE